jgi:hypothetical protein
MDSLREATLKRQPIRFLSVVEQADVLGDCLGGDAPQIGARQAHERFGLGTRHGDRQALFARQVHHPDVFDQTIHEHHAHTPIAGTRHTTFKQSGADPPTPVPWQDRHPYLRMLLGAGEVGSADNGEVGIGNDEDSIA